MRIMDCVLILFRKRVDPVVFDAERNCVKPSWSESLKVRISVFSLASLIKHSQVADVIPLAILVQVFKTTTTTATANAWFVSLTLQPTTLMPRISKRVGFVFSSSRIFLRHKKPFLSYQFSIANYLTGDNFSFLYFFGGDVGQDRRDFYLRDVGMHVFS